MPGQDRYVALPNGSFVHVPGDATPEQLSALRTKLQGINSVNQSLSKATSVVATPKPFTKEWFQQGLWRAGAGTADLAPAAGATAGGMIGAGGGPLSAVGGAGMGGMGGAALQQIMRRLLGFPDVPKTSGEAAKDIAKQGTTQAAIQGVTELLPLGVGPLQRTAETQYERALAPTTKANKVITEKITPELIRRGEHGSLEDLMQTAKSKIADLNPQLDAAYSATSPSRTVGSGTKILQDLDALKGKYMVNGEVAQPQAIKAIEGIQDIVRQQGADINPDSLRKLKSIFDDPVAQRGGYAGADLTTAYALKAQKAAANSIRDVMSGASPDVAALNKEISFWLNVQKVTRESGLRRVGQQGGLTKILGPLAAGTAGAVTGARFGTEAGVGAAITAELAALGSQAMRSPAWRTASAVYKNEFAMALARGDVGRTTALLARLAEAARGRDAYMPQQSAP
jgi:hypothetical protein